MPTRSQFLRMAFHIVVYLPLVAVVSVLQPLCGSLLVAIPTSVYADEPARPNAAILQLVDQLDANQFALREDATERLVAEG